MNHHSAFNGRAAMLRFKRSRIDRPAAARPGPTGRLAPNALSVAVLAALSMATVTPARAESDEVAALRQQVQELTRRLDALAAQQAKAAPAAMTPAAAPAPAPGSSSPSFMAGPVKVTLGGFVELMVVNRSRNEAADWA